MKSKPIFLSTLALALPMAVLMQTSAMAEANDELKAPPATGQGRQMIAGKLDRIRLDKIFYDGLPLGEVVKHLMDEARKRDPEKKGVNFMLTSFGNADTPSSEPVEPVDINSITIKIMPPLSDVRLVDALDAVVKVADRPIKYSIEDYGVVFTLRGHEPEHKEEVGFAFPGGTPKEFLKAVEKQYKVSWSSVADIPDEIQSVHIPALRMNRESLEPILRRGRRPGGFGGRSSGGFGGGFSALGTNDMGVAAAPSLTEQRHPLEALVALYNSLQQAKPELGHLLVEGDFAKPAVVMFIPSNVSSPTADFQMKAFPLKGIPEKEWDKLAKAAEGELENLAAAQKTSRRSSEGRSGTRLHLHHDTGLLVVLGPPAFIEAVGSFVTAWHANQPPPPLPTLGR